MNVTSRINTEFVEKRTFHVGLCFFALCSDFQDRNNRVKGTGNA